MPLVNVTAAAAARIKQVLDREGKLGSHGLRLRVIGGGCSGLQYQLSLDEAPGEHDTVLDSEGVQVFVDDKSALYLAGSTLNFVDTLQETGFKIENPNANSTCGCGQSFGA